MIIPNIWKNHVPNQPDKLRQMMNTHEYSCDISLKCWNFRVHVNIQVVSQSLQCFLPHLHMSFPRHRCAIDRCGFEQESAHFAQAFSQAQTSGWSLNRTWPWTRSCEEVDIVVWFGTCFFFSSLHLKQAPKAGFKQNTQLQPHSINFPMQAYKSRRKIRWQSPWQESSTSRKSSDLPSGNQTWLIGRCSITDSNS